MNALSIDALPGFRRRILLEPAAGSVSAELEDDYHHMAVTIAHERGIAMAVSASMGRAPWTTCPGAELELSRSFIGRPLAGFGAVGEREWNCTHLHDLALLAAAHAADPMPTVIDILVSDPVGGIRHAELRRNGDVAMRWRLDRDRIAAPDSIAGCRLRELRDWIASLDESTKEAARLLRWGAMLAGGRSMVIEKETKGLPRGKCYTFQPDRFAVASRLGAIVDLSASADGPLANRLVGPRQSARHAA